MRLKTRLPRSNKVENEFINEVLHLNEVINEVNEENEVNN